MPPREILINALSVGHGGSTRYIKHLLAEFNRDDRGFRFTVAAMPGQLDAFDAGNIEIRAMPLPAGPGTKRVAWRLLAEHSLLPVQARSYDLLYCQGDIVPVLTPVPAVVLIRNMNIFERRWTDGFRTRMLERLVRLGLPRARRVVFPSRAAVDITAESVALRQERVRVVHYGVEMPDLSTPIAEPERPYVFLPAAVEPHKNIEVIIDALPLLGDSRIELRIAGHSMLYPDHSADLVRRAEELGVADRLVFLGEQTHDEVFAHLRGAVAMTFPSFIESFGHPILESLAAACPLIASNIPTCREIAAEAALFFPPNDATALAQAIDNVQANPEATQARVQLGLARARNLSWKRTFDSLCEVFEEALAKP